MILTSFVLVASACDTGEVNRLREELDAAKARVTEAHEAAQRNERLRQSTAKQLDQMRDHLAQLADPADNLVVLIPLVGRLTWECNDDREFAFTFTPEQATITVEQSFDGQVTRKRLHPSKQLTSVFAPADINREWTVTYRHKAATISAGISVVPAVRRGACFIRNSTLEQNRQPN